MDETLDSSRLAILRTIENLIVDVISFISRTKNQAGSAKKKSPNSGIDLEVSFRNERSRFNFAVILYLLSKIHKMILQKSKCTRRELYYQNVSFLKTQKTVDTAMKVICGILDVAPWDLGVLSTSKGLIAGPAVITMTSGENINCSVSGGSLIPNDVTGIRALTTQAKYVLLLEKDAVFQKVLDDNNGVVCDYLLITGKGYPDINTRYVVKYLSENCKIPIFALMDADPHGIAIMCIYRFGPMESKRYLRWLAVPNIKWLGVHPTDIIRLNVSTRLLTEHDRKKVSTLCKLDYIRESQQLLKQVNELKRLDRKAEIEDVAKCSSRYLTSMYIPRKLINGEYF